MTGVDVIIVTQNWDADLEQGVCSSACPGLCETKNGAFKECLSVHTQDGTTGSHPGSHPGGVRANVVDHDVDEETVEDSMMAISKMIKHKSYLAENVYMACTCMKWGDEEMGDVQIGDAVVFGKPELYGGIQIWGRTGCNDNQCFKSCQSFLSEVNFKYKCVAALVTKAPISERVTLLAGHGTLGVTNNMAKKHSKQ